MARYVLVTGLDCRNTQILHEANTVMLNPSQGLTLVKSI